MSINEGLATKPLCTKADSFANTLQQELRDSWPSTRADIIQYRRT